MRKIRFRAWDNAKKKMVRVKCLNWEYLSGLEINDEDSVFFTLMQYTGLEDKKGKEIYEGDIVKCLASTSCWGMSNKENSVVEYKNEIENCGYWPFCVSNSYIPRECEIIGNIYENPELLEAK